MKYLKRFNESVNIEDEIILIFSDLIDKDFKVKYMADEDAIIILKEKRKPFSWDEISDKMSLFFEHIQDEYKGVTLSYLTEAYYMDGSQKKMFWFPNDPFNEVWNIFLNDSYKQINRDDIEILSIEIFTDF